MDDLILWGAGGHGRVVLDVAKMLGRFRNFVFIDDACHATGDLVAGVKVFPVTQYLTSSSAGSRFVVSIGRNDLRAACFMKGLSYGLVPATLIHPSAVISESACIGEGTVVMAKAVINVDAKIGRNCILNTGSIVEHDCRIDDHVHISPGAILGGAVTVHALAQAGMGAILLAGSEVGQGAIVGAGAVLLNSVPPHTTVVGIPARSLVLGKG